MHARTQPHAHGVCVWLYFYVFTTSSLKSETWQEVDYHRLHHRVFGLWEMKVKSWEHQQWYSHSIHPPRQSTIQTCFLDTKLDPNFLRFCRIPYKLPFRGACLVRPSTLIHPLLVACACIPSLTKPLRDMLNDKLVLLSKPARFNRFKGMNPWH